MHPTTSNTIVTATILIDVVVFIFLSPLVLIMFSSDLFCISRLQTHNTIILGISRLINITNPYSSVMLQIGFLQIASFSTSFGSEFGSGSDLIIYLILH